MKIRPVLGTGAIAAQGGRFNPLQALRRRISRWIAARIRRQPGPVRITRQRIYIVPTRFGYGFAVLLLVMLLGAMNYSNSMAFALTFLLMGLGLLGMHHTHANLLGLQVRTGRSEPVFAGDEARFELWLENLSDSSRYTVALGWPDAPAAQFLDVPARSQQAGLLALPAPQRGWLKAPRFAVATEFPLGLLHAWTWIELDMQALIYPRPAPPGTVPPAWGGQGGLLSQERAGVDEFIGLRAYAAGDAPKSIHWKNFARLDEPVVKRFGESQSEARVLHWDQLAGLDTEARLSLLTRWLLEAEAQGVPYRLVLPGQDLGPALAGAHRAQCLRALALYDLDESSP
jgi:uncharacterized protein (DUF58 family)